MSDTDPSGLWPKPDTLAAGDEELVMPYISPDPNWSKKRPYQEDGHLAADDYDRRNPCP